LKFIREIFKNSIHSSQGTNKLCLHQNN
jgi:hypothetical protein